LFYLLSILFFLKWAVAPRITRISWIEEKRETFSNHQRNQCYPWFILSLLFFIMATLSKPSVVMLPFVLALCVWWWRGRIGWRDAVPLAPFLLISAFASAWTIWEQKFHASAIGPEWAQSWPERLIIAGRAMWFYLAKLAWPDPLIFIYPRWEIHSSQWIAYLPLLVATVGLVLLWLLPGKLGRALFFAAAYYVISLFPVLGFFDVYFFRYSFVSDHFQYLASMGPLALAGAGMTESFSRLAGVASLDRGVVFSRVGLCSILLILLAALTWQQSAVYHDLITLYTRTLAKNPGCWMAHYNLGIALHDRGETDQAMNHYRQAIELRPDYAEAHYNLGRLLAEKGGFNDAVNHYEAALALNPTDAEAHNNLGATLFEIGRVDDAIAHYQQALAIRPDYAEASCNLANALIAKGDFDGAIARYTACLAAIPDQEEAQYNFASALLRKGRTDEAIVEYQKVLQMHPESSDAHANLGSAWLAKGRVRDAMAEYTSALRISPENLAALSNLAWLLATSAEPSLRDGSEAVRLAERAESASSRSETQPTVLRILAAAYAEAGQFAEAKETAQHALEAANVQGNTTLADALQGEIALYDLGLPYHKQPR
jgi:tetratricopeptide (TPR) repeat protein